MIGFVFLFVAFMLLYFRFSKKKNFINERLGNSFLDNKFDFQLWCLFITMLFAGIIILFRFFTN